MLSARVVSSCIGRLRGLLGTRRDAIPILLVPCGSIHTFGMGYPLDACFLDASGTVLRSIRHVEAGRFLDAEGAHCVLERPASVEPWPEEGMRLRLTYSCSVGDGTHDPSGRRSRHASQRGERGGAAREGIG